MYIQLGNPLLILDGIHALGYSSKPCNYDDTAHTKVFVSSTQYIYSQKSVFTLFSCVLAFSASAVLAVLVLGGNIHFIRISHTMRVAN